MKDTISAPELRAIFPANLRVLLKEKESVAQTCREIGVNRTQFNRYLSGESYPRPDVLHLLCEFFKVDARILLEPILPEQEDDSPIIKLATSDGTPVSALADNPTEDLHSEIKGPPRLFIRWAGEDTFEDAGLKIRKWSRDRFEEADEEYVPASQRHPMDTAPTDGTPVLLFDEFGAMHGKYVTPMSFEDFQDICDDGDGEDEWHAYDKEERADPEVIYDDWAIYELGGQDGILDCQLTGWAPLPFVSERSKG